MFMTQKVHFFMTCLHVKKKVHSHVICLLHPMTHQKNISRSVILGLEVEV